MSTVDSFGAVFEAFYEPPHRDRLLALLSEPKRREKLRSYLPHPHGLRASVKTVVPSAKQTASEIYKTLIAYGAQKNCELLSENPDWDTRSTSLAEALERIVGGGYATIISCVPGKLTYYEAEGLGERFILRT